MRKYTNQYIILDPDMFLVELVIVVSDRPLIEGKPATRFQDAVHLTIDTCQFVCVTGCLYGISCIQSVVLDWHVVEITLF